MVRSATHKHCTTWSLFKAISFYLVLMRSVTFMEEDGAYEIFALSEYGVLTTEDEVASTAFLRDWSW